MLAKWIPGLALCAALGWAGSARAQGYMFEPSSEGAMQWGDVTGDGVGESFMSIDTGSAAAATVCRQFLIPVFLPSEQCEPIAGSAGRFCQRALSFPSFFISRTICTTVNTPPMDWRMRQDTSSTINTTIASGAFEVVDASTVSAARDTTVAFGIPYNPRFARPEDFGNVCPAGSVLLSAAGFIPLGSTRLCVQTTTSPSLAQAGATVNALLNEIGTNLSAETVDINLPRAKTTLEQVLDFVVGVLACYVDADGITLECIGKAGHVTVPSLVKGLCPTVPNDAVFTQCAARGEQSTTGCAAIACIEALNSLGYPGCIDATAAAVPTGSRFLSRRVGSALCGLIWRRNHFYTAPITSFPKTICSQQSFPACSVDFVLDVLLRDARNQAPGVLQGRPIAGVARPLLTGPLPINSFDPGMLYYLGNSGIFDLGMIGLPSGNTSNPIFIDVDRSRSQRVQDRFALRSCDVAVTNIAQRDHLLEGKAVNCLYQDGILVKSIVVGTGAQTRNALANELAGPFLLGGAQDTLQERVREELIRITPPPPCVGRGCPPREIQDF
jgi:hypothetical protein